MSLNSRSYLSVEKNIHLFNMKDVKTYFSSKHEEHKIVHYVTRGFE
jgi:hypothetical protein